MKKIIILTLFIFFGLVTYYFTLGSSNLKNMAIGYVENKPVAISNSYWQAYRNNIKTIDMLVLDSSKAFKSTIPSNIINFRLGYEYESGGTYYIPTKLIYPDYELELLTVVESENGNFRVNTQSTELSSLNAMFLIFNRLAESQINLLSMHMPTTLVSHENKNELKAMQDELTVLSEALKNNIENLMVVQGNSGK